LRLLLAPTFGLDGVTLVGVVGVVCEDGVRLAVGMAWGLSLILAALDLDGVTLVGVVAVCEDGVRLAVGMA
jgi:hypothetical protein